MRSEAFNHPKKIAGIERRKGLPKLLNSYDDLVEQGIVSKETFATAAYTDKDEERD